MPPSLTLISRPISMRIQSCSGLVAAACNQLRQHARHNVAVTCRLLDTCSEPHFRDVLAHHADAIYRNADAWPEQLDKLDAEKRYGAVQDQLLRLRQQST